jgi:uncharacterized protein (DUF305 family)
LRAFHSAKAFVGTPSIPKISMSYPSLPGRVLVSLRVSLVNREHVRFRVAFVDLLTVHHQTASSLPSARRSSDQFSHVAFVGKAGI